MCEIALIGARTEVSSLRSVLSSRYLDDLNTDLVPEPAALRAFPSGDGVVAVTLGRCSCELLRGLGVADVEGCEAHLDGPGYLFRRALASATVRFGSIRLLIYRPGNMTTALVPRTTTLGQLLRTGLAHDDALLHIRLP